MPLSAKTFQTAEMDAPWVAEMLNETAGAKHLLLGHQHPVLQHQNLPCRSETSREIERAVATNLEAEVGKTFEKQTKYFLSQAGRQICLNGVEKEQITQPIEKFRRWGLRGGGRVPLPNGRAGSRLHPAAGLGKSRHPRLLHPEAHRFHGLEQGRNPDRLRSRLIAETPARRTGTRPALNALSKEIDTTLQIVSGKAGSEIANIYVYHDRQDPAFGGVESIQRNTRPWSGRRTTSKARCSRIPSRTWESFASLTRNPEP